MAREYIAGRSRSTNAERLALQSNPMTGGTTLDYTSGGTNYRSHTFTSTGDLEVTESTDIDVLILAGGGGGSNGSSNYGGSGGGAGGLGVATGHTISTGTKTVTIGSGSSYGQSTYGGSTTFDVFTATGGQGASQYVAGDSGTATASSGSITEYRYDGINGRASGSGAGGVGTTSSSSSNAIGKAGGYGISNDFRTGSDECRAGGGGSGSNKDKSSNASASPCGGGLGRRKSWAGGNGATNMGGGGGGGGGRNGGGSSGGSGLLVLRYELTWDARNGEMFYEPETNKEFIFYNNNWTEV